MTYRPTEAIEDSPDSQDNGGSEKPSDPGDLPTQFLESQS